ncbi:MAG: hypothetical protein ACK5LK_06775, partial [Chthoniobacterales bacterium]
RSGCVKIPRRCCPLRGLLCRPQTSRVRSPFVVHCEREPCFLNASGNLTLSGTGLFEFTDGAGFAANTTYTILGAANLGMCEVNASTFLDRGNLLQREKAVWKSLFSLHPKLLAKSLRVL